MISAPLQRAASFAVRSLRLAACGGCAAIIATSSAPAGAFDAPGPLIGFAQAWAGLGAYSTTVNAFERKGPEEVDVKMDYAFHKPSNVKIHLITGPNAGANLAWDGGDTVTGWRGGLLSFFKKTFSLHDSYVSTTRGASIDQLSFGAILDHAQHEPGKLATAPPEQIDGVTVDVVTLTPADPAHDGGLTREVVELSPSTHLPVRVLGYEGSTLVRKVDFSKLTLTN
jgi:hypothetical protein